MTACVYDTVRGTSRRTNTVEQTFRCLVRELTRQHYMRLHVNCHYWRMFGIGPGKICQYCGPVNISFYVFSLCLSSTPVSMAAQLQPSARAWFARGTAPLARPPTDGRRVERECYFPREWVVTPAGQWSIWTLGPYQAHCKPIKAVGKICSSEPAEFQLTGHGRKERTPTGETQF